MITSIRRSIAFCIWWISWLAAGYVYGQSAGWVMDDLAYALANPINREQVMTAIQQFQTNTQVSMSVTSAFEQDVYHINSEQQRDQWLRQQAPGIAILLTLDKGTKAFRTCEIQVSPAVEALLPVADCKQIRTGLMEFYFRNSPVPTDAYTEGLLAGIAAMEKKILENKEKSIDIEKEILPVLVEITDIDDEFSAGISDYSGNMLNVNYTMKKHDKYDLKVAKFRVYDVEENLVYDSEKEKKDIDIKEEGQFTWDGKMNTGMRSGEFISYNASPFKVKLIASTNALYEDIFEASATASVDEDAEKWDEFKFKDAINDKNVWSYTAFKRSKVRNGYENSLTNYLLIDQHPLDYLNENLVFTNFLGKGPILINIRFAYVIKLFEQSLSPQKLLEYKGYLQNTTFSSKLRMSVPEKSDRVSNHGLGFALDLDATENPMVIDEYIYHFIGFVTGEKSLYGRRERSSAFVDELKTNHLTFVERLSIGKNSNVFDTLILAADKIFNFENRKTELEKKDVESEKNKVLYSIEDLGNNKVIDDIQLAYSWLESIRGDVAENQIQKECKQTLQKFKLIETEILLIEKVIEQYEKGMLQSYYVPSELEEAKDYLIRAQNHIEEGRLKIHQIEDYIKLNDIEQMMHDLITYAKSLLQKEKKQETHINNLNELKALYMHIQDLYSNFTTLNEGLNNYKSYIEKTKKRVNIANLEHGRKIMNVGFFNLRADFVKDWLNIDYTYWGGFYGTNHDFMHFEVSEVDSYKGNGIKRLHENSVDFYKEFFKTNYPDEYKNMYKQ